MTVTVVVVGKAVQMGQDTVDVLVVVGRTVNVGLIVQLRECQLHSQAKRKVTYGGIGGMPGIASSSLSFKRV
jgi:hypothetical protein